MLINHNGPMSLFHRLVKIREYAGNPLAGGITYMSILREGKTEIKK